MLGEKHKRFHEGKIIHDFFKLVYTLHVANKQENGQVDLNKGLSSLLFIFL